MKKKRKRGTKGMKAQSNVSSVRATISFPSDLYETLEGIAEEKKVSLAWVVRELPKSTLGTSGRCFEGENSVPTLTKLEGGCC